MIKYNFKKIESKWQKEWQKKKIYEPLFSDTKKPFYNLMMFPYPSAEGLHVGNMYAFVGSDIYGRFKRMQGYDVFEPIGLDGFGIHSENYAMKIGTHPMKQAKVSEKRFYKQLAMIGNGFAWDEHLETYDPEYYKWTQWIFIQLFKKGLAYRAKAPVNWCPSCKTVLADEQVIQKRHVTNDMQHETNIGVCERCDTPVIKKELEQWFFKITAYAEQLLKDLEKIDWSEKVKIAQRNWIGKSEGAEIDFGIETKEKPNFVLLHGYQGSPKNNFFPWLKKELGKRGYSVYVPALPSSNNPDPEKQVEYVLKNASFNSNTVIVGHSLGAVVAMKIVERLKYPIRKLVLAGGFMRPKFEDHPRPFAEKLNWKFNTQKIRKNVAVIRILHDENDKIVPRERAEELRKAFGGTLIYFKANDEHICGIEEPVVLQNALDTLTVFTTRPDTLFGATYIVVSPEHSLIENSEYRIQNIGEVRKYIEIAGRKSEEERINNKEKSGVELKGIKVMNPANGEKIPVWVSDYVLSGYGTGAIMAVPAHDERDFEFAQKFKLSIKMVVCPNYPSPTCPVLDNAYEGDGYLVDSGKFTGIKSEDAKWKITAFVGGKKKIQYRLRDWLISRQRYWGPPIPMIFCEKCDWQPIPEEDLPVKLPFIKNFRPEGKGKSPLASVKSFYETKCPKCGGNARRETDVSDTFLDSSWYYIGYLMRATSDKRQESKKIGNWKLENENSALAKLMRRWLPVHMYIGGAEHSVLHLLYTRFLAKAFRDLELIHFDEPFTKFRAHGLLIKEGAKMSKSKGNVVNPDEYIKKFGADALRMYLMFLAPFEQGGDFRDSGILGITRFLERVYKIISNFQFPISKQIPNSHAYRQAGKFQIPNSLTRLLHRTIKKVTEDIETLNYNTAISALMILLNEFEKNISQLSIVNCQLFLKLLAPFAPHIAEELWQQLATSDKRQVTRKNNISHFTFHISHSVHKEPWPTYNQKLIEEDTFELVVQINGKYRGTVTAPKNINQKDAEKLVHGLSNAQSALAGAKIKKVIFVKDRLINFVV